MEESEFRLYAAYSRHIWKHNKDQCSDALHLTRRISCTALDPYSCKRENDINPKPETLNPNLNTSGRACIQGSGSLRSYKDCSLRDNRKQRANGDPETCRDSNALEEG